MQFYLCPRSGLSSNCSPCYREVLIQAIKKTTALKRLLESPDLSFFMEVHSGVSARIAVEAGFKALWGSGLSISAASGVRDSNELSWTQVLEVAEIITDAAEAPLLIDGDTGYGDFNIFRRVVRKLEDRGVAGICIEDKLFPKTNSFVNSEFQPLADIDEFVGKIKAGKDSQRDSHFIIVARVEALIAGWGLSEALKRAQAYADAGADAILIHSLKTTADEVLSFKREWGDRLPVLIVPTKYYSTPTEVFRKAGFSGVIWANHLLRSSIHAMQKTAHSLAVEETLSSVEDQVAPLSEVFRLQGDEELREAELRYLPRRGEQLSALVLAASRGHQLGDVTKDLPKALLPVGGKRLLDRQLEAFNGLGIKDITVVRGYLADAFDLVGLRFVDNNEFESTQEVYSFILGLRSVGPGTTLMTYGDVAFHKHVPMELLESEADICLAVDPAWQKSSNADRHADYVRADPPYERHEFDRIARLVEASSQAKQLGEVNGEWMGVMKLSPRGKKRVIDAVDNLNEEELRYMRMVDFFNRLTEMEIDIEVLYTRSHWLDVDELHDLLDPGSFGGVSL